MQVKLYSCDHLKADIGRIKVKSRNKVKTDPRLLAKAHNTYAFGKVESIQSDADQFKHTPRMPKLTAKVNSWSVDNFEDFDNVGRLFKAILYFKGNYPESIAKKVAEKQNIFQVNTTISYWLGNKQIILQVHTIKVKRANVYEASIVQNKALYSIGDYLFDTNEMRKFINYHKTVLQAQNIN